MTTTAMAMTAVVMLTLECEHTHAWDDIHWAVESCHYPAFSCKSQIRQSSVWSPVACRLNMAALESVGDAMQCSEHMVSLTTPPCSRQSCSRHICGVRAPPGRLSLQAGGRGPERGSRQPVKVSRLDRNSCDCGCHQNQHPRASWKHGLHQASRQAPTPQIASPTARGLESEPSARTHLHEAPTHRVEWSRQSPSERPVDDGRRFNVDSRLVHCSG